MTAFGQREKLTTDFDVNITIRSYNSRYLDISLYPLKKYMFLESKIKALIAERINRGRIDIRVQIRDNSDEATTFEINKSKAKAYYKALVELQKEFNIDSPVPLELLVGFQEIIQPKENKIDIEACWEVVEACLQDTLDDLLAMRKKEGAFIEKDILNRLDYIGQMTDLIEKESEDLLPQYQKRLMERIQVLTGKMIEIDPQRVAQEAAIIADKCDICEEIVRIKSHIKQFRDIMIEDKPAGQKLNFLIQEFNREFNTLGSKTDKAKVSHFAVDLKSELEKIREQIQNVQ